MVFPRMVKGFFHNPDTQILGIGDTVKKGKNRIHAVGINLAYLILVALISR
jgi:hypothetical protein